MISHSKCKKCGSILNISELTDNLDGIGMVCKDKSVCKENQKKQNDQK
jgi:hypothetical protein